MYMYTPTYRGDILTIQKGNVCASSWMDRKVVTAMSTTAQPETGTVLRRQKDGTRISVPCPLSIIDYNMYMGQVDRGDQVRAAAVPNAESFTSIYFTFCSTLRSQMRTSSRRTTVGAHHNQGIPTAAGK